MKRVLVLFSLLFCVQLYSQENVADMLVAKGYGKNTRAIIVANEDYQSYSGGIYVENEDLAIFQAERFKQLLIKKLGVLPENIQFYPDALNTNIKLAITKLQRSLPSDANLIFYYRGKTYTDETGDLFLIPVDVSDNETFYMFGLKDLCTRLNTINKTGIAILIDALQGTKSFKTCMIDNGFTEGEVPLPSVKNMSLYRVLSPSEAKAKIPVNASKPELTITMPLSKTNETEESTAIIEGKVKSDCKIEVISVEGQEAHFSDDGHFMARVTLEEGENLITVQAKNCAGWTSDYVIFKLNKIPVDAADVADSALFAQTDSLKELGKNYAVIIGISKYADPMINSLYYPIFDARKIRDVLLSFYTFEKNNVVLLENPSKWRIVRVLDSLDYVITSKDNLLIFYAGHGNWDESSFIGYWLAADAIAKSTNTWMMNSLITEYVSQSKARHTLVIADACFGGSIFKTRALEPEEEKIISDIYLKMSKKAMTSADLVEVPDESIFVKNFVQQLSDNKSKYLSSEKLFFSIKSNVVSTTLVPQFGIIKNAGDQGGDFIFFRKQERSIKFR
ncbi:MAG: caspase family protein [Bacteroidia bacterium]|nr:caspase family protein [Bacteroidia bacterium]